MTRHYVTTAAAAHLPQLRVLHASMRRHCGDFRLWVLAEGSEVADWARSQPDIALGAVGKLLDRHPTFAPENLPGPPRTPNELACTWRWRYLVDVMRAAGGWRPVLAVDSDVMFWGSPEPVFEEIGEARAAVLPHAFAAAARGLPGSTIESHRQFGRYNGGFVYFADPRAAERMAELTRECSRATHHTWPDGRVTWGDQGALELIEEEFGARVIRHPGAAPGPWNIHTERLTSAGGGGLLFGGLPLVSYHYSSLRPGGQLADAPYEITARQAELVYRPYLDALASAGVAP